LYTSYFDKVKNHPNVVSIAGRAPVWFTGREYKKLAPKYWFFKIYKQDGDVDYYIEQYYREVLSRLNAQTVYDELGENAIITCWEYPGQFCHRYLVSSWFRNELGLEIGEWSRVGCE